MPQNNFLNAQQILEQLDNMLRKNDYQSAKKHLMYWLDKATKAHDNQNILLLNNELMGLCRKLAEKSQALMYADNALKQIEKMNIQDNVGAATTYLNSATVYKAFGMADRSINLFQKAKMIYEQKLSPDDTRLSGLYNNMGLALVDLRRFDEAFNLYEKAISVLGKSFDTEPEQAITYLNMASAAEAQYGLENAESIISAHIKKAMSLLDFCKNRTDGNYAFVCEKCASVFSYYGYFDYENQLAERYRRIYDGT